MRTELFHFHLPPELIAQHPARPRDSARLLVVDEGLQHRRVLDLPDLLEPADLLVLNNTRVLPSRLVGRRGESTIEVTLHAHGQGGRWRAFAKPARRCRPGDRLTFGPDFAADVLAKGEGGEITLQFACGEGNMIERLETHGGMPLPPTSSGRAAATRAIATTTRRCSHVGRARSRRRPRRCISPRR